MTIREIPAAVGLLALIGASSAVAQRGVSPGSGGQGATVSATARAGGVGGGSMAGANSPSGVGAGTILSGLDRAAEATNGNANASAGFGNAMDLRASAQTRRTTARANAQATVHASEIAKEKANEKSVLNESADPPEE